MIEFQDKGFNLFIHLENNGVILEQQDGVWISNSPDELVNQFIESYNPWSAEKSKKFAEIDVDFQHYIDSLTAGWPEGEIKTWNKQEAEALALQVNPQAITPTLTMIATQRGLSVPDLATRVLRDAAAFSQASGYYVGLRHKARQLVQAFPNEGDYHRLPELWSIKFKE